VSALARLDSFAAQRVIEADAKLDTLQRRVEEEAVLLIARRQPMASDLRDIVAAMRIANELERVGDLAKNNAKRVGAITGIALNKSLWVGVEHLSEIVLEQLKTVLDAYTARDDAAARGVRERDTEIDALYTSIFRELLTYMMEDPRNISQCAHLLFCAKNLERIGDHATNVAEIVHYALTGTAFDGERPKADTSASETVMPA
jgi:phosphate transport system protein